MNRSEISFLVLLLWLFAAGCRIKDNPYFVNDVILVSPANEALLHRNELLFKWKSLDAFRNTLQISSATDFNTLIVDSIADSTALITNVSGFDLGKTYYWQVLSEPNAGAVITSPTRSFTVIDTRDSLTGTFTATLRKQTWDLPSMPLKDTTYTATVTITKQNWNKLKIVCSETPSLTDMQPHPDNANYHFGTDGLGWTTFQSCVYDKALQKITLEYVGGDSSTGYHYWFTIFK